MSFLNLVLNSYPNQVCGKIRTGMCDILFLNILSETTGTSECIFFCNQAIELYLNWSKQDSLKNALIQIRLYKLNQGHY